MKLSCLPCSLFPQLISGEMSIYEWASKGRAAGLDAVDFSILFFHSKTRRAIADVKKALADAGTDVAMITTYPDFSDPDAVQRRRELAHTFSDIEIASEVGAEYLRITSGQRHPGADKERTLDNVSECFLKCADYAREAGVKLVFENHAKPGAWDDFDFDFETDVFLKLAARMRGTDVRINFDTGNTLAYGDDPIPVFKQVIDQVETIHVAEMTVPGRMGYSEVGEGVSPIREILTLAKQYGFNGLVSIEEASGHGMGGIERSVKTTREIWESIK